MRNPVRKLVAGAALVLGLTAVGSIQPAGAATINVTPGHSIQAAVDAASPGDTINVMAGTYYEGVVITKDRIKLVGSGATLAPPYSGGDIGITISGSFAGDPEAGPISITHYVTGVSVSGFTIRGFGDMGVFAIAAKDTSITNTTAADNGGYGFFANSSTGTKMTNDVAHGSGEAGFYVGDSPSANATISTSTSYDNQFGFFLRDAQGVTYLSDDAHGNCAGMLVLADAPGPAGNATVKSSRFNNNNRVCAAGDESPPLSGIGILVLGGHDNTFSANTIQGNVGAGPSIVTGGVVLLTDPTNPSATAPKNNVFTANIIKGNAPDVSWDGTGTGNTGSANICGVGGPPIC